MQIRKKKLKSTLFISFTFIFGLIKIKFVLDFVESKKNF